MGQGRVSFIGNDNKRQVQCLLGSLHQVVTQKPWFWLVKVEMVSGQSYHNSFLSELHHQAVWEAPFFSEKEVEPCLGSLFPVAMKSYHPRCTRPLCVCSSALNKCSKSVSEGKATCLCWRQTWERWDVKSQGHVVVAGTEQSLLPAEDAMGLPGGWPWLAGLWPHRRVDLALWGVLRVVGYAKGSTTGTQGSLGHPGESQACRCGGRPQPPSCTSPCLPLPIKGACTSLHGTGENQDFFLHLRTFNIPSCSGYQCCCSQWCPTLQISGRRDR